MGKRERKATRAVRQLAREGDTLVAEIFRLSAVAHGHRMLVTAALLRQAGETGGTELASAIATQERAFAHRVHRMTGMTSAQGVRRVLAERGRLIKA